MCACPGPEQADSGSYAQTALQVWQAQGRNVLVCFDNNQDGQAVPDAKRRRALVGARADAARLFRFDACNSGGLLI